MQGCVDITDPMQRAPPGPAGVATLLILASRPPPHVTGQSLHGPQSDQMQSWQGAVLQAWENSTLEITDVALIPTEEAPYSKLLLDGWKRPKLKNPTSCSTTPSQAIPLHCDLSSTFLILPRCPPPHSALHPPHSPHWAQTESQVGPEGGFGAHGSAHWQVLAIRLVAKAIKNEITCAMANSVTSSRGHMIPPLRCCSCNWIAHMVCNLHYMSPQYVTCCAIMLIIYGFHSKHWYTCASLHNTSYQEFRVRLKCGP